MMGENYLAIDIYGHIVTIGDYIVICFPCIKKPSIKTFFLSVLLPCTV